MFNEQTKEAIVTLDGESVAMRDGGGWVRGWKARRVSPEALC